MASSFAALRRQHAFLAAFGDRLAAMPSSLPDVVLVDAEDTGTLWRAQRTDGTAGFVFITWHQPHIPLPTYRGAQFEVTLDGGPVTFPAAPLDIPAGTVAHWPVNLEVAGVTLEWATASPLTLLEPAAALPTLVLAVEAGIPVELKFAAGTEVSVAGDTRAAGNLAGRSMGEPEVLRYSPNTRSFEPVRTSSDPAPGEQTIEAHLLRTSRPVPASYGGAANRAAAPQPQPDLIDELAQEYSLDLPGGTNSHTELEIHWAGDVARILLDGDVVADRFWDGSPWILNLADLGIRHSNVTLQILPLSPHAKVGLPAQAQLRRDAAHGDLVALDAVKVLRWTAWQEG